MALNLLIDASNDTEGEAHDSEGRAYNLCVWGEFDGATVSFEISPDQGLTWITPNIGSSPAQFTDDAAVKVDFPGVGTQIRCTVTGGGASTEINAVAF